METSFKGNRPAINGYVGCSSGRFSFPPLHLMMSKSVKSPKQMLLEGADVGRGVALCGEPAGVWSWCPGPTGLREPLTDRESALLIVQVFVSPELPLLPPPGEYLSSCAGEDRQSVNFPAVNLCAICVAAQSWGEEGVD